MTARASTVAAEAAFRDERAAVLATLIRQLGDFQLAEDALQDAFATAIVAWERDGVPQRPGAWITTAAVGSSRVDLQACKLEYSIVSPK